MSSNSITMGSNSIHRCIPIFMVDRNGNNIPYPTNECQRRVSDIVRLDNNAAIDELSDVLEWSEIDCPLSSTDYRYFYDRIKDKLYYIFVRTMKIKRVNSNDEEFIRKHVNLK
jgi:hypothetical protein